MNAEQKRSRRSIVLALGALALAVGVFRVPLETVVLVGLVLACPLMMLFMHRSGHGTGGEVPPASEEHVPAGHKDKE